MKDIKRILLLVLFSIFIFSCESNKVEVPEEIETDNISSEDLNVDSTDTPVEEEVEDILDLTDISIVDDEVETIDEVIEDETVIELDEVIPADEDDEEYLRSVEELSTEEVTKEEFTEDKAAVLQIISELSSIMERKDTKAWLDYIDEESIKYYSTPANIRKAQKKLPDKTLQLHGIGDYFKYVFIPSRKRSQVDEIRYISKTNIKAVEVKDDDSIVIYYYFVKVNGQWMVHIPPIS